MSRLRELRRDERGTTIAELLVGLSTGLIVLFGVTTMVLVTMHATKRVSTRVDATQRSRVTLTRVLDQLHSACIAPKVSPIRSGSGENSLGFIHASGAAVSPVPTLTVLSLNGTTLSQTDYAWKEGTAPLWTFKSTPSSAAIVMTHVTPLSPTRPVFTYYGSSQGTVSATPLKAPLTELDAARTIQVSVALKTDPRGGPGSEEATPSRIQGSATFRLSAASFNKAAPSMPCV